jgi:hypothetical protein
MGVVSDRVREQIYAAGVEPRSIADPGDTNTLDTEESGYVEFVTGGAETRTLADPAFIGQILDLFFRTDGGDLTITASSQVNQATNTSLVAQDVGDHLRLVGHYNPTDGWEWRVLANDGWTLS